MKKVELKDADKKVKHFDISSIIPIGHPLELGSGTKASFMLGELKVSVFKSAKAGERGRYVPFSIEKGKETVWAFANEKADGASKIAFLLTHDAGFHLISVISGDKVLKVVPLDDLEKCHVLQTTTGRQIVGGRKLLELFQIKGHVADSLGFVRHASPTEEKLLEIRKEALKTSDKNEKNAEKERRRQSILARVKIGGYREDGKRIFGIPVMSNEWECLPEGTGVILVTKYENGVAEDMYEAFFVQKRGSASHKQYACKVSEKLIAKETEEATLEISWELFSFNGEVDEFPSITGETLELLRKKGVNCGSQFAVRYKSDPQQPILVELVKNEVRTKGNLVALV